MCVSCWWCCVYIHSQLMAAVQIISPCSCRCCCDIASHSSCSFPSSPWPDPFEAFIIFSIRHEIRRIDLHKRDYSLLVPGLRNTIALDFHFNRSLLYWTDVVEDKIYRGRLSDSGGSLHSRSEGRYDTGMSKNMAFLPIQFTQNIDSSMINLLILL